MEEDKNINQNEQQEDIKEQEIELQGKEEKVIEKSVGEFALEEIKKLRKNLEENRAELNARENEIKEANLKLQMREENLKPEEERLEGIRKFLADRESDLDKREENLKPKEQDLDKRTEELDRREKKIEIDEASLNERKTKIDERDLKLKEVNNDLQSEKESLSLKEMEIEREISEFRSRVLKELQDKNSEKLKELEIELAEKRNKVFEEIKELRENAQKEIDDDKRKYEENKKKEQEDLENKNEELTKKLTNLAAHERLLKKKEEGIDENREQIDNLVEDKIKDKIEEYKRIIESKDNELNSLRDKLSQKEDKINSLESFSKVYGENPDILSKKLQKLEDDNNELRRVLANATDIGQYQELQRRFESLKEEENRLRTINHELEEASTKKSDLEIELRKINSECTSLKATCESLENQLEQKNQELIRLTAPEGRLQDRDARIEAIKIGVLGETDLIGSKEYDSRTKVSDEINWLDNIWQKCKDYGLTFNKRIFYAFHTALKINEWSTIAVLAGVSGTGKSELPRLYAQFGGLNFCSVAVQPNWDSQEAMLGYFNSIDNQFEPEELLRFLVQCTEDENYKEYMSLVLLDEMNLAHVEYYFAEFLSKLESRRGLSAKYLPEIEVKLGAGVKPFGLKLSRTLLWTGTMNQDETTKSLSDKVLDRGIVINFPRPKKLISRGKMKIITKDLTNETRPKLHKSTWESWTTHEITFSDDQMVQINKYKKIVEEINDALENVGRALGHRVWQSIEYYIANYPTVRAALHYDKDTGKRTVNELTTELIDAMNIAFEDQIVQKIMPKLRGIETRDKQGKNTLDRINEILEENSFGNLSADFQIAREQGYGQFIWNSAKYLNEDEDQNNKSEGENTNN